MTCPHSEAAYDPDKKKLYCAQCNQDFEEDPPRTTIDEQLRLWDAQWTRRRD